MNSVRQGNNTTLLKTSRATAVKHGGPCRIQLPCRTKFKFLNRMISYVAPLPCQILSIECGTAVARRLKQALDWQNNFWCITLFCTFLCCHCKTTTRKYQISRFMEDVNTKQRLCLTFPEPRHSLL